MCRRRLVRGEAACARLAGCAVGPVGDGDDWQREVVVVVAAMPLAPDVTTRPVTSVVTGRRSSSTGVGNARRGIWSGDVAAQAGHDVSFQKDDGDGSDRHELGRVVRLIAVLPQHGQRWSRSLMATSLVGDGSGSGAGTASSRRQSASFPAR